MDRNSNIKHKILSKPMKTIENPGSLARGQFWGKPMFDILPLSASLEASLVCPIDDAEATLKYHKAISILFTENICP